MNALKSYKASPGPAGSLMTAGGCEKPEPDALPRAARRLGVSAATLAAAGTATSVARTATALAHPAAGVGGTVKSTSSLLVVSMVKGSVIGLCLSGAAYVGLNVFAPEPKPAAVDTRATATMPGITHGRIAQAQDAPRGASITRGHAHAHSVEAPSTRTPPAPNSAVSTRITEILPPPINPTMIPPNARFEDESPPHPALDTAACVGLTQASSAPSAVGSNTPADVRLTREVTSLDRARTLARQGKAAAALHELDAFEQAFGYVALRAESLLVRIDVLLSLSRRGEAAGVARRLLAAGAPAPQRSQLEALAKAANSAGP